MTTTWPTLDDGRMLVLRTNHPDYAKCYNDFEWPTEVGATATAPDWDPNPRRDCGGGLHGLIWGCGAASLLQDPDRPDTTWLVVAVDPADIATPLTDPSAIPDKVRFRAGEILHVGSDRAAAIGFLQSHPGADQLPVVYGTATAGDGGTATAGHHGTATAGRRGTATAGDCGSATAGDCGSATAGHRGTATAGEGGALVILFWDSAAETYRRRCAEVDGERIKADTPYRLNDRGEFEEVNAA